MRHATGPAGRSLRACPVLVQEEALHEARRAAALQAQVERLVEGRIHDEDAARELRAQLTAAQDAVGAARASAEHYRAGMEEVGALPLWGASLTRLLVRQRLRGGRGQPAGQGRP